MPTNRRRFFRVPARLRFTFAWGERFELFRCNDLSAAGAYVVRHVPASPMPPRGAVGECAFNLESMEVRCLATVVRSTEVGFAVRFEQLPRHLEDRICGWVFRQETRREE
ncbi:MAG: PilZ domain-containing protein [Myxococcota bacterium]